MPKIDDYSYVLGFSKGYEAADSSFACWAFDIFAVLNLICCFIVLHRGRSPLCLFRLNYDVITQKEIAG